jgi:trigger factor
LKIDTEILDTHQAKLTVVVDEEMFESAKRQSARQLSKRYKIAGFRPGKAPYAVVLKHLGEGAIMEQAINQLVDDVYPKAIKEAEINPYGPGSLEDMPSMEPPTFNFLIPLAPEVELAEYKELRIDFEPKQVEPENIQQVLDNLRDSQATIEAVERPAEEGDMVYILLSGEKKGEEDPEKKVLVEERKFPVIIEKEDSDNESEYPFPGFSRKLIGLKAGDKKSFQNKFKSDYEFEELRGVTGIYKVQIEEIKGRALPELSDEFAQSVGEYETLEQLKEEILQTLTDQNDSEQLSEYDSKIIDQLVENSTFKYPPQMVEDEIDDFIHDLEHQLSQQGITIDVYLKSRSIEMEELRDEVRDNAEARMKRGLILMEVANREEITIPTEEINERIQKTIEEVAKYYSEEEAARLSTGENLNSLRSRIATDEIISRTFKQLRNIAMGKGEEEETEPAEEITEEVKASEPLEETQETDNAPAEEGSPEAEKPADSEAVQETPDE